MTPENHAVSGNHVVTMDVMKAPNIAIHERSRLFSLSSLCDARTIAGSAPNENIIAQRRIPARPSGPRE